MWIKSLIIIFTMAIPSIFVVACATVTSNTSSKVTVPEIIEMTKAGVSDQEIINKIQQSQTVYKLDGNQYANLRQVGVSNDVINYMQETYTNEELKKMNRDADWESWNLDDAGY